MDLAGHAITGIGRPMGPALPSRFRLTDTWRILQTDPAGNAIVAIERSKRLALLWLWRRTLI
jgi:hypothetical protein